MSVDLHRLPAEPLRSAFTFRCYAAGHMMYTDAGARVKFSEDLKTLLAARGAAR